MNFERLYQYRFREIEQSTRVEAWNEISPVVWELMDRPKSILDPAAGRCEFINAVPAQERWAVDQVLYPEASQRPDTTVITSDIMLADLPSQHFEGVFISNFLEHLESQEAVAALLEKMHGILAPGGRIGILGPNIRYASREYWDFADHVVPLSHLAVAEHLYAAGFEPAKVIPRFLPYSFRQRLPSSPQLIRRYLRSPWAWRFLGKQFFLVGVRR